MASFHSYLKSPEGNDRKQLYESSHLILYTFYALISKKIICSLSLGHDCVCVCFICETYGPHQEELHETKLPMILNYRKL